ncbi:WXG100 family type VII secretion target [Intrasporangium calvum]|uniref:ESAT-6-like protein n=1 Tax=Intrasporangium calvum TaxID=53358 RepID=A0ABT5GLA5_9MICO|nr:WXG100 family type VII secretion target [Intrasporangium calvum]MDC5698976.1 WXG100 family type VII secretion target [Intrasporangium calvum]
MARSVVDTEAIRVAAVDIQRLSDDIQSATTALRGRLGSLSGAWEGPARKQFDDVMERYNQMQQKINSTLGEISTLTAKASNAYEQHETATRAMFS